MRFITRIHLSDCGWQEAYYPGTTIQLASPRTGQPVHTVFSLENTGGKTSFLALVLSCFDTHEQRFLKTLIRSNQKFGDYFGTVPAFILVEWDLSDGQTNLLESRYLVTGQIVVPRGEGRQRELDRRFFAFRTAPGLKLDDIPAPGLKGFDERGRLNGYQDVLNWLHEMRSSHPGNFHDFSRQSDWKRKLAEDKIDTELLAAQVDFNRSEGGIEDFLNFRSESQFLRKFLAMTVPETEASAVRGVLAEHVVKLSDLPRLEQRRDAMRELKERFSPFVDRANSLLAAQDNVRHRSRHAASLRAALVDHGNRASKQLEELSGMTAAHETAAQEARDAFRTAEVQLASADVESARRRQESAERLAETRDQELKRARRRRYLLQGALSLRDILDARSRSTVLLEAIDAENADLQPRRDALCRVGADLVATLHGRAEALRQRQRSLSTRAEELSAAAREAEAARTTAHENAQAERRKVAQIDVSLDHARDSRAVLEAQHTIEPGESAGAAAQRHAEASERAAADAAELLLRAASADRDAATHRDYQGELKAERSGLENKVEPLWELVREGEETRRRLAFDTTILELAGDSEVDPESEAVERLLTEARRKSATSLRENERQHEILQADRESLEATGLASIDVDVQTVAARLREAGIVDAQPYAVYLAGIQRPPEEIRGFAELDPARFAGVAVPNRHALEKAQRAMASPPPLGRPVTVAIASDAPSEVQTDRFVLPVDEPGTYDRSAARDLQHRTETELARIASSIEDHRNRIDRLESTLREVRSWRKRFGGGQLTTIRQDAERHDFRIAEIEAEIELLPDRIEAAECTARELREQVREQEDQVRLCNDRSNRAEGYRVQWEERIDGWREARERHRQDAASAERLAEARKTERDDLMQQVRRSEDEASDAARQASTMEREARDIAYSGPGGQPDGNLDILRRDYEQDLDALNALEQGLVRELRGQRAELERELAKKEERFQKEFDGLDPAEVEAEAARDGLREAADDADATLDRARETAAVARANAVAAGKQHRSEREKRARDIEPDALADFSSLELEALALIASEGEKTIVGQRARAERETEAAQRYREKAARYEQISATYRVSATTLGAVLGSETVPVEPMDLPQHDDVAGVVSENVAALRKANDMSEKARTAVYESYDIIRQFTNTGIFARLESEREVASHLRGNDPLAAAATADRTAALIDDRLKTIEHDLSRLDDDLHACVTELERLLRTALHILRRMIRDGRVPDHVPRFGGQSVFRTSADLSRIAVEQRREILRGYVADLAAADRVPETGQDIASELVERMTVALGKTSLGIRLLKPKGEGDTEHMPIDRVTVSGGELLTAAMMIYLVLARLRAETMPGGASEGGVLIMDNPLGKANKTLLLKTQIGLADAMGIQLFYTTGIQDTNALAEFENIVRLRRSSQSKGSRRIHVEVMRAYVDKPSADGTARPAAAAE